MQPKTFIRRMAKMRDSPESEGRPQATSASQSTEPSLSSVISRMSISALCQNNNPLVSFEAIASQMRLGGVIEETHNHTSRTTPQPDTAWEQPESPSLSESFSLPEAPTTPTKSGSVSPREEDDTPRSLKRKRQPPKLPATPTSSTRSTPTHSPSTVVTTTGSPDVARKIRWLSPVTDESLVTPGRPRLRSEAKRMMVVEAEPAQNSSHALQYDMVTLRAQLENEKRANTKLKAQASKDKDGINALRAEMNALSSEFASERREKSNMKEELVALRADLELLRYEVEGDTGGDNSVNAETREGIQKIIAMNEMLRRVIQGERIHTEEMHGKLQSLRKKVGPLMAKVDGLQQTVEEMKAHFSAHDAPIELIMDFVRNFHQWWVDRYNARREGGGTEPIDGPQAGDV